MAGKEDMKLTVRAVTRNWLKADPKRTADCMVEFCVDSDLDCSSAEIAERVKESEMNVSLRLMLETVENGGLTETDGRELSSSVHTWMLEKFGCPKLVDLFWDNGAVPYVELEWNGWTMHGTSGPMTFADRPWRKLNKKTREKAERDAKEFVIGETELSGAYGRPITFGEYRSRFLLDGSLKPEFWK